MICPHSQVPSVQWVHKHIIEGRKYIYFPSAQEAQSIIRNYLDAIKLERGTI